MNKYPARRVVLALGVIALLAGLTGSLYCRAGNDVIRVITASATSYSEDSLPVTDLIDPSREGFWKPKSRDSGSNEGLFFQFQTPTLIDWVEVKVKGNGKEWARWRHATFFLDGRVTKPAIIYHDSGESTGVEYNVTHRNAGKDTIFRLGAGHDYEEVARPLRVKVKSIFISSLPSAALSVRFLREASKEPLPVEPPVTVIGEASATSTLAPEVAYSVQNLFDSRLDFAWATDGKRSAGVGEQFTIKFAEPQTVAGLIIWNGYQRSETHYLANSRPSRLQLCVNGTTPFSILLKDRMGEQYVPFPEKMSDVREIAFSVDGVFPGSKYRDMVISEIKLVSDNGRIMALDCPIAELKPANALVQRMLDMTWGSYMQGIAKEDPLEGWDYVPSSIRLRSNGSFVSYRNDLVMEGNWEETADGVRLFGKKYYTNPLDSAYLQAVKEKTAVQIFQADVKIFDVASTSYADTKKALQAILADRMKDRKLIAPYTWWTGLSPSDKVYAQGKTQEELLRSAYNLAVKRKTLLVVSPLFIEMMAPSDGIYERRFPE